MQHRPDNMCEAQNETKESLFNIEKSHFQRSGTRPRRCIYSCIYLSQSKCFTCLACRIIVCNCFSENRTNDVSRIDASQRRVRRVNALNAGQIDCMTIEKFHQLSNKQTKKREEKIVSCLDDVAVDSTKFNFALPNGFVCTECDGNKDVKRE